ncbi:MFS transporter [Roseomonas sp. NAR14]|uniref:MFS transporter n=1 Tax=Roseomonas acroporae TaxID=2937791 RepID=A0A9X1Y7A9_9PROT|nr:MFS transporter [Roseomonas acroporae]MCK8785494.1 MFS transporter [Roseomonas acroporae]
MSDGPLPQATEAASRAHRLGLILGLGGFAGSLASRSTDPLVGVLSHDLGVTPEAAALLSSAFALPFAGVQPVLGPVGEAAGKLRVIVGCLLLLGLALAACALAPGFESLLAGRFLAGMAAGGVTPLALAALGDRTPLTERQLVISRFLALAIGGQVLGGAMSGVLEPWVGWRGVMLICAASALVAAWLIRASLRGEPPEARHRFDLALALRRYRALLASPAARLLFGAVFTEGLLVFGLFPYLAPLLARRGLGGPPEAGLVVGAFGIGGLGYAMLARPLLARVGQRRMVMLGGAGAGLALLGYGLATGWPGFVAASLLLGFSFYMLHNSIQARATELAPQARGSAMALHASSFFLGQTLGPVLFGLGLAGPGLLPTLILAALGLATLGVRLGRR